MERVPAIHLKFNHLEKEYEPIRVCVEGYFSGEGSKFQNEFNVLKENANNIEYGFPLLHEDNWKENNILANNGCLISECNNKNKYSLGYRNCTGAVIVGTDKNTGENISLFTHQNRLKDLPKYHEARDLFLKNLEQRIRELVSKSKPGSIDSLLWGGEPEGGDISDYKYMIKIISEKISSELGFEPVVATGPTTKGLSTDVYFDNKNRRLYIVQPKDKNSPTNEDFMASDIDSHLDKYNPKYNK